jgi:hypothetical protein
MTGGTRPAAALVSANKFGPVVDHRLFRKLIELDLSQQFGDSLEGEVREQDPPETAVFGVAQMVGFGLRRSKMLYLSMGID